MGLRVPSSVSDSLLQDTLNSPLPSTVFVQNHPLPFLQKTTCPESRPTLAFQHSIPAVTKEKNGFTNVAPRFTSNQSKDYPYVSSATSGYRYLVDPPIFRFLISAFEEAYGVLLKRDLCATTDNTLLTSFGFPRPGEMLKMLFLY